MFSPIRYITVHPIGLENHHVAEILPGGNLDYYSLAVSIAGMQLDNFLYEEKAGG